MRMVRNVMGMPVTVEARDQGIGEFALEEVFAELRSIDQTFSPFIAESEVGRINRGRLRPEDAGPLTREVLNLCRLYEIATEGCFSAWIGGRLDPSGLVKGWAVDRACGILERHGCRHYLIDAAGDVRTRRPAGVGTPWRIGVRHPVERNKVTRVILGEDLAVATSGTYEKGAHVLDPRTGEPARHWLSFTVVGPDILEADVYATAALAMGRRGLEFVEGLPRLEAYAIDADLMATWTPGFQTLCDSEQRVGGAGVR
jgi:FAD:protein FMN transferase